MNKGRMQKVADEIATRINTGNGRDFTEEELRDYIDVWTGSRLDYEPLNILTDMVAARMSKELLVVEDTEWIPPR